MWVSEPLPWPLRTLCQKVLGRNAHNAEEWLQFLPTDDILGRKIQKAGSFREQILKDSVSSVVKCAGVQIREVTDRKLLHLGLHGGAETEHVGGRKTLKATPKVEWVGGPACPSFLYIYLAFAAESLRCSCSGTRGD